MTSLWLINRIYIVQTINMHALSIRLISINLVINGFGLKKEDRQ